MTMIKFKFDATYIWSTEKGPKDKKFIVCFGSGEPITDEAMTECAEFYASTSTINLTLETVKQLSA